MIRSRIGLMGLCAVVFGVMAFGVTSAQATSGAHWWILNSAGTVKTDASSLTAKVNVKVDGTNVPILHSKIAGVTVLFECTGISAVKANLLANGSIGEAAGKVEGSDLKFTGCKTRLNGTISEPCEPKNGGTEAGVILTKPGHGLIILHEGGVELTEILPDPVGGVKSETFAVIEMPGCSIGSKVPVIGKATLKDCLEAACTKSGFKTFAVEHLVEVGPLTELWTISKTEEHKATILGSSWAFLEGTHVGLKWEGEAA